MAHRITVTGVDTSCLPRITREESKLLLKEIKQGNKQAEEKFVKANLRLVLSLVQRFSGVTATNYSDDLFQAGCVGLMKAIAGFDPSFDVLFSTYAVPMITGEIRRFLRDTNSLKVSRNLRDTAVKALNARDVLSRGGKEPTLFEIAREIDVSERQVADALDAVSEPVSLYDTAHAGKGDEDGISYIEKLSDEKSSEERWNELSVLHDSVMCLPEREQKIIVLRYFKGKTQVEISKEVGISQAQVSRLEKNALERLKRYIEA